MNFHGKIERLIILLVIIFGLLGAKVQPTSKVFDPQDVPVHQSRILRVPEIMQGLALKRLGSMDFCTVPSDLLKELFNGRTIDTKAMLDSQATEADQAAEKREKEAAMPFFQDQKTWMLAEAKSNRDLAAYIRKLSPNFHTYLIKGQVYCEGTDGFDVRLKGHILDVNHDCLSSGPLPSIKYDAIVVFLEREIQSVHVTATITE